MSDEASLEKRALDALDQAFDQPSETRAAWVEQTFAGDPALIQRVLKLLGAESGLSASIRTGGARDFVEDELRPERAGAYKITGLIGRGGMGAVYTAERDAGDFEHVVAVKVVRQGVLNDALIGRFENERQILASLNHPGIARLFDGGSLPDGSPYIVMELVDGTVISDWVRDQALTLDDRLSLFARVCNAVAHAHQNLIVHRDITPNNVLVTSSGEAKLIDFGIAKLQAEDLAEIVGNSIESLTYTPGFAAPERLSGAPVNTLSDVFSLGRLLNEMLGGVSRPADVDAIIERASEAAPEDRYPTATALAEDVKRYLTGYAVDAQGGDWSYRFKKFLQRRKLAVSFGALAAGGLLAAFAVTAVQYVRAERALDRATERFEQARELSRTLVFDTYDDFAKISGTLEARRNLAGIVDNYVTALAEDPYAPEDILFDIGTMSSRLSDLYGGIGWSNLGETEKSGELLQKASSALESLLSRDPENAAALSELILVKRSVSMQSLFYKGDPQAALAVNEDVTALAERGIALAEQIVIPPESDPEETVDYAQKFIRHFWSARADRLQILNDTGAYDEALEKLAAWRPELDAEMFERLGGGEEMAAYMALQQGQILISSGRYSEAIEPLEYAVAYRTQELAVTPEDQYQQAQLLTAYNLLADALRLTENIDEALEITTASVDLARGIVADDAEDAGGKEALVESLTEHAAVLAMQGSAAQASNAAQEATTIARQLVEQFPDERFYKTVLAEALTASAQTVTGVDAPTRRCAILSEASDLSQAAITSDDNEVAVNRLKLIETLQQNFECS